MKFVLRKNSKFEDFRWWFTYNHNSEENITTLNIYFQFKQYKPVLAHTMERWYHVPLMDAREMVERYLKTQIGFCRKFTWLVRKA